MSEKRFAGTLNIRSLNLYASDGVVGNVPTSHAYVRTRHAYVRGFLWQRRNLLKYLFVWEMKANSMRHKCKFYGFANPTMTNQLQAIFSDYRTLRVPAIYRV